MKQMSNPRRKGPLGVLYPQPDTMAERVLLFIRKNPGITTNGVIVGMEINPSPARTCIRNLLDRGIIQCAHQLNGGSCPLAMPRKEANKLRNKIGNSEHVFTAIRRF